MEDRKLNINAPLLSVRRFLTSSVSSNENDRKKSDNTRLNRRHTLPPQGSDFTLDQVTEPVAVPFEWEQIPGRRKDGSEPQVGPSMDAPITPKLPPGRVDDIKLRLRKDFGDPTGSFPQIKANPTDCMTEVESFEDEVNDKGVSDSGNEDNDAYSDALDSLSPAESLSVNGCISGHSGSDGLDRNPSRTFSLDPQTRDFMMGRFLCAAKAMALESPHYTSKKKPLTNEQPREDKREDTEDRKPPHNQCGSIRIPHYGLEEENVDEESEDDDYPDAADISARGCGLLPRLCLKNSLGVINSVPELKIRIKKVTSPIRDVKHSCRTVNNRSQSPTVKKDTQYVVYKRKSNSGVQSPKLPEVKNISSGKRFSYSGELTTGRSNPYRHSISPYRNGVPQSPFRVTSFLGVPKDIDNFKAHQLNLYAADKGQGVLSNQRTRQGSGSVSPAVEKTVYIDTVNNGDIGHSNLNSSHTKDFDTLLKILGEEIATEDDSFHDVKCLNTSNGGGIVEPEIAASDKSSLSNKSHKCQEESQSTECTKVTVDRNLKNRNNPKISKLGDPGKFEDSPGYSHLPPPLPKSPSESWLWRTLPSVVHSPSRSHHGIYYPRKDNTTSSISTKWETIVKTSKLHHDHVRYSEELISHASQQKKV